jgi:hypothetical protein
MVRQSDDAQKEFPMTAPRPARWAKRGAWVCALALLGACSDDAPNEGNPVYPPQGSLADSGSSVITTPDAATPAPAPVAPSDSGTPPIIQLDASGPAPFVDASMTASPEAGSQTSGDGAVSGDGGAPTGPVVLPEPDKPGPYTVKEVDNVGEGFENPIDSGDMPGGEGGCALFISLFTSDQMEIDSYARIPPEYKMDLYTLWYPEGGAPGQRFPVLSWANGTCAHTVGYSDMIKHVVSHGFIVIATHSRQTGSGTAQIRGIDWVLTQDTAMQSPLFGRVNKEQIGVFGHSQGGGSTGVASRDPRVRTSVLMHGGSGSNLHAPAFFLTGEMDNPTGVRRNYDAARVPAAFGNLKMSNHITMMNGKGHERMAPEVAAWFRYILNKDEAAKKWFVGADCVLCKDPEWVYAQKDLQ